MSAFYEAPEAEKLFAATAPIKSSADTFGGQVEWVGSALSQYASTIRPIVERLTMLKSEAQCFVGMVNADEDWQEDEDKVNRNNDLIRQVDAQVAALMAAERTAANQINKLYGGTQWTVDDGTSQSNMYGFNAGDIPLEAKGRPWGDAAEVDEPWYVDTGNAIWSGVKGVFVDGVWGTIKGIWGLINPFDWETFKASWGGLWTLTGNVFFDPAETGEAWKQVGKGFIAWDEWEKDPARATGLVAFNVLTLPVAWLKLGKAGQAGKLSLLDKVGDATKLSKIGELANAGKLAGFLKLNKIGLPTVGDLAKQIDGTFKDILARDPGLGAALRNADDLAARADAPTIRGDDIVSRADDLANARQPELAGVGGRGDDSIDTGRTGDDIGTGNRHGDHSAPSDRQHESATVADGRADDATGPNARGDDTSYTDDDMGRRRDWQDQHPSTAPQPPSRPPDSHLSAGDPVYYRQNSTAIGYDSSTMRNLDAVRPEPGFHDVVVHGERSGLFRPGLIGADGADYPVHFTHPNQIADAIRSNPHYNGGPIRLVSCHTGAVDLDAGVPPAAQQVADALGVPVKAPTNAVGVDRYGPPDQVPLIRDGGTWETFYPKGWRGARQ